MKNIILNIIKQLLIFISALIVGVWVFGPLEPSKINVNFENQLSEKDLDKYLSMEEKNFNDITAGVEKRIIWANNVGEKTPLSIIYIHGFSATSEEVRPVPDRIANRITANLYYTRLTGHGRGPRAMSEPRVIDWMSDMTEAIAIGRRIGHKIIIISTSTGSTLSAAAALNPIAHKHIAGLIFISPNFGINNPLARLLTWPAARWWVPLIAGKMRHSTPRNRFHSKFWTTSYPTIATIPMAAVVKEVAKQNFEKVSIPALFFYSLDDKVVDPNKTKKIASKWGGDNKIINVTMTEADDIFSHVIAGDIVSPNQTTYAIEAMVKWIRRLPHYTRKTQEYP